MTVDKYFDDEIDLHGTIRSLFRYKWLMIGLPVLLALAAWAITRFYLPQQYQARALLIVTKPLLTANFDPRLQTSAQLPDGQSLINLATTPDLLNAVFQDSQITSLSASPKADGSNSSQTEVILAGPGQLWLTVTSNDPEYAAAIANVWAEQLARRLNNLYGPSEASLEQIEDQISLARENWAAAEQSLLDNLPQINVDALDVRLEQARTAFQGYLDKVKDIDLLSSDARLFSARLVAQDQKALLASEDVVSLITLYQRSAGGSDNIQLQVSTPEGMGGQLTVAGAQASLNSFISSLQDQRDELQGALSDLEAQISGLSTELESARYQKEQLTVQVELALAAYQALSNQAEGIRIALSQNDQIAKVAGMAQLPSAPYGPRALVNALIAAGIGFILAILIALTREWWRTSERSALSYNVAEKKHI